MRVLARVLVFSGLSVVASNLASLAVLHMLAGRSGLDVETLVQKFQDDGDAFVLLSALIAPITWLLVIAFRRAADRRSVISLGLDPRRPAFRQLIFGAGIAVLATGLLFLFGCLSGVYRIDDGPHGPQPSASMDLIGVPGGVPLALVLVLGFLIQGSTEELVARGYLQRNMMEWRRGPSRAVWTLAFPSFLFAALHFANPDFGWTPLVNTFLIGVALACVVALHDQLWWAMGFHAGWNLALASLWSVPVSGLPTAGLLTVEVRSGGGGDLWFGGGYGPEGGLAVTLLVLLAVAVLLPRAWRALVPHSAPGSGTSDTPSRRTRPPVVPTIP